MAHKTGPRRKLDMLELLLEEYGQTVFQSAWVATRDVEQSNQAFEEVFVHAFRHYERLLKAEDQSTWFRDTCTSVCRGLFHERSVDLEGSTDTEDDDEGEQVPALAQSQRVHTLQVLRALTAEHEARQRVVPAKWLTYAVVVTVMLALLAVALGANRPKSKSTLAPSVGHSVGILPSPLQDLPVKIVAQYRLSKGPMQVNRLTASDQFVYTSQWKGQKNRGLGIQLLRRPMSLNGQFFGVKLQPYAFIEVTPPSDHPENWKRAVGAKAVWRVTRWNCQITGNWAVGTVEWLSPGKQPRKVLQLYTMYIPTRETALTKTFETSPGIVDEYQVAVGAGRVVLQSALSNAPSSGYSPTIGLPIQVFRLVGTQPESSLSQLEQIPSTFGFGLQPTVTQDGVIFQVIEGQDNALQNSQVDSTWYLLAWDGNFTELNGPPADGRPHWAIRGGSGSQWWAETTPDTEENHKQVLVLMSQLSSLTSSPQSPALSLSGAVDDFTVNGSYVYWIQTSETVRELVIGEVQ